MSPNRPTPTDLFSAVGDGNRRRILHLLAERDRSVGELATDLGIAQPSVTQHLSVLRAVGLVASTRVRTSSIYRLVPAPLDELTDWVESLRC